jgi:hypothetical protein
MYLNLDLNENSAAKHPFIVVHEIILKKSSEHLRQCEAVYRFL